MVIPAKCKKWADQMRSDPDSRQIIENIEADACVDPARAETFFARIEGAGKPVDLKSARDNAVSASHEDPSLYCSGNEVPANRFQTLSRMIAAQDVFYVVDESYRSGAGGGTTFSDLETCDFDTMDNFVVGYDGASGGNVGKPHGIAWVAEASPELDALRGDGLEMARRLGLPSQYESADKRRMYVRIAFPRMDLSESLHVPRVLDAAGHSPFRPNPDCSAEHGMTFALSGASGAGFPEAVLRSCKVGTIELSCEKV